MHPLSLGADICCDSAHKTLPVLTGGAYLHISENAPELIKEKAQYALSLFASTSPSYLILQSLDFCNTYLENYKETLLSFLPLIDKMKAKLQEKGFSFYGDEPMKLTISAKSYGYKGTELADILSENPLLQKTPPDLLTKSELPDKVYETLPSPLQS